jgi:hypothetical protein
MTRNPSISEAKEAILHVLGSRAVSYWLKDALRTALQRDCVDTARDAELLARLLRDYCNAVLRQGGEA